MKTLVGSVFWVGVLTLSGAFASNVSVDALLKAYSPISNALVEDELEGAQLAARSLSELASQWLVENPDLMQKVEVEKIKTETAKVITSEDLDEARIAFIKVSQGAVAIVQSDTALQAKWQLFFCPMVAKKQGYWIQPKGEEIANPYMGTAMPGCGGKKPW